jgi:hypothetical protein
LWDCGAPYKTKITLRTTNAAGWIRDESFMNLGGRVFNNCHLLMTLTIDLHHLFSEMLLIFWKLRENGTNVESSLGPLKTVCRKMVANVRFARIGPRVDALGLCTV